MNKAVYFFCMDGNVDPVAPKVFNHLNDNYSISVTALEIDGLSVLEYHQNDDCFQFVRLGDILSHARVPDTNFALCTRQGLRYI